MRKRMCLFPGMAVVLLFTILFAAGYTTPAIGNVNTVQAATKKKDISREGKKKRSIRVNDELELEVKKTKGKGVKDRQLKWTVEDSTILAFEDMDDGIYDDEMEFVGMKPGKTTVTCTNTANKEKVTFTITVK